MKIVLKKYKSLKLFAAIIFFSGLLVSCDDFLNQTPTDGQVYSDYWSNKEQVLQTLTGAYQKFSKLDYTLFVLGEFRGDMLKANPSTTPRDELKLMEVEILERNTYARWDKFYSVINICNHVITLAPGVMDKDQTFNDVLLKQYVAEATFLRALTYFYLVRVFKDVPFITEPTSNDQVDFFIPQTPGEEILAFLKKDLEAINYTYSFTTLEESRWRASNGAIHALLADICLWTFDYDGCIAAIEKLEESNMYFLVEPIDWFTNFSVGATSETIFEIFYDESIEQPNTVALIMYNSAVPKDANFYVSDYAVDVLSPGLDKAGEVIRGNGTLSDNKIDDYQIWKYIGRSPDRITARSSDTNQSANFIIYRLADVFLMKAEAYSQLGQYGKATEYINKVRQRVDMLPVGVLGDPIAYEDLILEERAKELAYEGKRWFDLLRMGRRTATGKSKLIERMIINVPTTQQLVMKSKLNDENGWYMPVFFDEINRNKELVQNPYYDAK